MFGKNVNCCQPVIKKVSSLVACRIWLPIFFLSSRIELDRITEVSICKTMTRNSQCQFWWVGTGSRYYDNLIRLDWYLIQSWRPCNPRGVRLITMAQLSIAIVTTKVWRLGSKGLFIIIEDRCFIAPSSRSKWRISQNTLSMILAMFFSTTPSMLRQVLLTWATCNFVLYFCRFKEV